MRSWVSASAKPLTIARNIRLTTRSIIESHNLFGLHFPLITTGGGEGHIITESHNVFGLHFQLITAGGEGHIHLEHTAN